MLLMVVPSGEFGDEEGGRDGSDGSADGHDALEDALGEVDVEIDGVYFSDDWEVDGGEVDEGVAEVYL
jgi:hypothetical protein